MSEPSRSTDGVNGTCVAVHRSRPPLRLKRRILKSRVLQSRADHRCSACRSRAERVDPCAQYKRLLTPYPTSVASVVCVGAEWTDLGLHAGDVLVQPCSRVSTG
eukprot:1578018-Rhodomonas_salina.11